MIGIIGAMEEEVAALKSEMADAKVTEFASNNTYHPIFLLLCIFTVLFPHISFIRLPFSLSLQTFPVILYIIPYPMHKCQALMLFTVPVYSSMYSFSYI